MEGLTCLRTSVEVRGSDLEPGYGKRDPDEIRIISEG